MNAQREQRRLVVYAVTVSLAGIALVAVLYLLRNVLLVLYISTLLAIGFSPAVHWIERRHFPARKRRLPRWGAILLLYVGGLAAIALILAIVLPPFVRQVTDLWTRLPGYVDQFQTELASLGLMNREYTWSEILANVQSPGSAVAGVLGALQGVIGTVGTTLTVLLLPFYLLVEATSIQAGFLRLFAKERRPRVARITANVTLKVGAWLGGQLLLGMIIGTTAALGLWIIGVPYFYVLGLLAALGELVPVVGPILAAIPAIFMGWTVSVKTALVVAAYFGVQQFIENNFLVPRIMERQVGVSAVTVLVALLIGSELLGIVGALLAVPSAAIAQVLMHEFVGSDDA